MDYHYQWPKYLDSSLSEGRGWESLRLSPPPLHPDTPKMPTCARVFPRSRPMRRRKLFPRPYRRFSRDARPQWPTPCYDQRCQCNPEPPVVNFCTSQFDNFYNHEGLLDKTYTDKDPHSPAPNTQRGKESFEQLKPVQVIRNSDPALLGSNRIDLFQNVYQSEWNSLSRCAPIGYQSVVPSVDNISGYKNPQHQESPKSVLIPVCNGESMKTKLSHNGFAKSFRTSTESRGRCGVKSEKEDALTLLVNRTIFETSDDVTNSCQYVVDSCRNQLDEGYAKMGQESGLTNKPLDSYQNITAKNSEFLNSSGNNSQIPFSEELFESGSVAELPNVFSEESEIAVLNLRQLGQHPDLDAQKLNSCGYQQFCTEKQNLYSEAETHNSLVLYDPPRIEQSADENKTVKSENNVNTTEVKSTSNAQFSKDRNSYLSSSEADDSISSLMQQNQLLTDLLAHLISGNIESQKDVVANNQLQIEPENTTNNELVNTSEASIADNSSSQTISVEEPVHAFQDFFATDANIFSELPLPPVLEQEIGFSSCSNEQLTNEQITSLSDTNFLQSSEKITKASPKLIPVTAVNESTINSNSLMVQAHDLPIPAETLPSNIDFPSSDSESNSLEATLSSVTNYILEEPFDDFTYSLTSVFDEESSLEILSSCVKPNSVLKVKKPRKRYVKTVQSLKVKKKEKNVSNSSYKGRKLTSKCLKTIRKCKSNMCKEVECDSDEESKDSDKRLCDVEVQVDEFHINSKVTEKIPRTRDAETQCELTESHCNNVQVSFKQGFDGHCKFSNPAFRTEEKSNDRGNKNISEKETVSVMLLELPVFLKQLLMQTSGPKVEAVVDSKIPAKKDFSLASKTERNTESSIRTVNSENRTFALSYEDSFETRLPNKSERNYQQDVAVLISDCITAISKRRHSSCVPMEISPVPPKLSTIQTPSNGKKTPYVYGSNDRVLRKRKAVNYSDPVPTKRARFKSSRSEMEFENDELPKKVQDRNQNKISSGTNENSCCRRNKLPCNRNSPAYSKVKQTKKVACKKSRRRDTR